MSKSDLLLEAFLPYQLSYLTNMISQDLALLYTEKFGIAHTEWRVMAVLGISPGISAGQVAQKTAMDKVAVSRAINNMIKIGLIKRDFSDEDKRRSELKLSKKGRKMYEKIVPLVQNYEQKLLETLNQDEQAALDLILNKLTRYVSE
ncbi:MAG: MarR family transcriptional regulator [Emcibacteraceae bacterium]